MKDGHAPSGELAERSFPRRNAGASLKGHDVASVEPDACMFPPQKCGGLIEGWYGQGCCPALRQVSPAEMRGPH